MKDDFTGPEGRSLSGLFYTERMTYNRCGVMRQMHPFIARTEQFIRTHRLLAEGERVIIGLSGGADSVCLLEVLDALKDRWSWELTAVHIHHGIRGASADLDEAFARRLCEEKEIACHVHHCDVPARSAAQKMSEEEAGRLARREIFEEELRDPTGRRGRIALAHHADDNAETFIMNVCRGSGLEGLGGMRPYDGSAYVRPLLWAGRREIEAFVRDRGLTYRQDESNADISYTRNRIRHQILPALSDSVNSRTVQHINAVMSEMRRAERFVERQTDAVYPLYVREERGSLFISRKMTEEADPYLADRVIRRSLIRAAGQEKDIGRAHIESVADLLQGPAGRQISLPYDLTAFCDHDAVVLKRMSPDGRTVSYRAGRRFLEVISFDPASRTMRARPLSETGSWSETDIVLAGDDPYTKYFDYGIIGEQSVLRTRQDGDYMVIDPEGHRQKVGDFMTDHRIPQRNRASVPVLADGHHVYWIAGYRQSADSLVTQQTRTVIEWRVEQNES